MRPGDNQALHRTATLVRGESDGRTTAHTNDCFSPGRDRASDRRESGPSNGSWLASWFAPASQAWRGGLSDPARKRDKRQPPGLPARNKDLELLLQPALERRLRTAPSPFGGGQAR